MERKLMKMNIAKKVFKGNQKGKVFLTEEGKRVLENIVRKEN